MAIEAISIICLRPPTFYYSQTQKKENEFQKRQMARELVDIKVPYNSAVDLPADWWSSRPLELFPTFSLPYIVKSSCTGPYYYYSRTVFLLASGQRTCQAFLRWHRDSHFHTLNLCTLFNFVAVNAFVCTLTFLHYYFSILFLVTLEYLSFPFFSMLFLLPAANFFFSQSQSVFVLCIDTLPSPSICLAIFTAVFCSRKVIK